MTHREKMYAIGTGAAIAIAGLYQFGVQPYLDARSDIDQKQTALKKQLDDADNLFSSENRYRKIWSELQAGGLNLDASQAESQALRAVIAWAERAGVAVSALKPERTGSEQKFQVISFNVTGTGAMPDVARLLWAIETAPIPLQVNEIQITPRKEGTDDLNARFEVSALCLPTQSPANTAAVAGVTR